MTVRIRSITFDCADPYLLAGFWSQVTGFREASNSNHPDDPEGLLVAPDGSINLLFVRVAQGSRSRTVFTWTSPPADSAPRARDAEIQRVMGLGATLVDDQRRPDASGWVVLADPEGNEFSIERGAAGG